MGLTFQGKLDPITAGSSLWLCELDFCLEPLLQLSGEWWAQLMGTLTPGASSPAGSEEGWLSQVLGNSTWQSVNSTWQSVSCPPPGTWAELHCCTGRALLPTGPGYSDLCQNTAPHTWPGLNFTMRSEWLAYHLV